MGTIVGITVIIFIFSVLIHIHKRGKRFEEAQHKMRLKPSDEFNPYIQKDDYTVYDRETKIIWSVPKSIIDELSYEACEGTVIFSRQHRREK